MLNLHAGGGSNGRLVLAGRSLREVPPEVQHVADLRCLDLSTNELSVLNLPPLPSLTELYLADNALSAPTVQMAPLPSALRVIDLSANRLEAFPPQLLRLTQLAVLRLSKQHLSALPEHLSLLPQLVELDAGFNELQQALPLNSPGLPRLRRLVLRANALREVSLECAMLPSLTELDLADNLLADWQTSIGTLLSLKTLNLGSNRLRRLVSGELAPNRRMWVNSAGVHELTELCELSIAQNELIDVPSSIHQLRQLTILDARCNPLSAEAQKLLQQHTSACGARLRLTSVQRVSPNLQIGDESSAWHKPTILHARVTHVLSFALTPPPVISPPRPLSPPPPQRLSSPS